MKVGDCYLFMTVTHYFTGRVREITPFEIIIDEAAWIPNTGRLADCLKSGSVDECEPVGDGIGIPRCIYIPWTHKLPSKQKPASR